MSKLTFILSWMALPLLYIPSKIRLENASFEGEPRDATVPAGWMPCEEGTTPDILPGPWGVYQEPSHGNTYLGLITRRNGSYEAIGQRLPKPLATDECYHFGLDLAHSDTYTGYNGALQLRIWAGYNRCQKEKLLFESPVIRHTDWKHYDFSFPTEGDYHYIILEAHSPEGRMQQGNILLDNCSDIEVCDRA